GPWAMAEAASACAPPSENESGVTLTMPMTRVRSRRRMRPAQSSRGDVSNMAMSPGAARRLAVVAEDRGVDPGGAAPRVQAEAEGQCRDHQAGADQHQWQPAQRVEQGGHGEHGRGPGEGAGADIAPRVADVIARPGRFRPGRVA